MIGLLYNMNYFFKYLYMTNFNVKVLMFCFIFLINNKYLRSKTTVLAEHIQSNIQLIINLGTTKLFSCLLVESGKKLIN